MDNRPTRSSGHASRRTVLAWASLTAGTIATSLVGCSQTPQPNPTPTASPKPSATPTATPSPSPKPILKNRDPRVIATLRKGSPTGGVARSYPGAFPAVSIKTVQPLIGMGSKPYPWMAVSIVGRVNQLQIIDPQRKIVVHSVQIPDSHNGGLETLAWDQSRKLLYIGTKAILYSWAPAKPSIVTKLGEVPKASTIYELNLDSQGNVWGGTYPTGCVFNYTTASKKFNVLPRLAKDSDYVRRIGISSGDIVWVGTGAVNPRIFTFPANDPKNLTEIRLPRRVNEGFISDISVLGDTIAVSASGIQEQMLLNAKTKKWIKSITRVWKGREIALPASNAPRAYSVSDQKLFATSTAEWTDSILGAVRTETPITISAFKDHVVLASQATTGVNLEVFDLVARKSVSFSEIPLEGGQLTIQSLLGHTDGNVYLGGYMGDRIAAIDPATGKSWISPAEESAVNQIEGMIEFDKTHTFIGSYGSADLISMDTTRRDDPNAYKRLIRLATEYQQSRPFGWAKNSKNVFFGTVPEYGVSGGTVGMLDPQSGNTAWILDGGGKGFIKHHSIVSLCADEDFLYGTTSVRNGYGIPDTKGSAYAFKLNIKTKKIVWKTKPVRSAGALYSATLLPGWLVVADLEGIAILDVRTGKLMKRHYLTGISNSGRRPGWANSHIAALDSGARLIHSAGGIATLIDFEDGHSHRIGSGAQARFGSRLASTPDGKVYGTQHQTTLVELNLRPLSPSASASKTSSTPSVSSRPTSPSTVKTRATQKNIQSPSTSNSNKSTAPSES